MAKRLFQQSLSDHCVGRSLSFGKVVDVYKRQEIFLSKQEKNMQIRLTDNGIGIEKDAITKKM